ncbi:MAG: PQQ-binding-like beta-propeller repeat protein [Planctomycetaceae bacterium]|nr:PQQ-binding-like beta-propeller repeat protein [Planctomycetaceae bacterium]
MPILLFTGVMVVAGINRSQVSAAELNWPFRAGPTLNSHIAASDAEGLPKEWDEASGKGIVWKCPLENAGHSTPIIGDGRIWLTAATEEGHRQYVYCIDQATGKVIHHILLFENAEPEPLKNAINTYASPSCALDSTGVYVHFGTYGTAKLDRNTAHVIWQRRDINCRHFRGPGSSPIIFENLLILTFDGIDHQFLTALDCETGKTVWRTERTTDYGDLDENGQPKLEGDLRKSYSTPAFTTVNGRTQVVSVGSRAAFAYDIRTGEELWTIRHDDFNASAPPCFYKDFAILNTGSRNANLLAVRLADDTRGDVSESHVVWNRTKGNSDLAAPVCVGDHILMVTNNGVVSCLEAGTGEELHKIRLDGTFTASPVSDGKLLYVCNEEGDTYVIKADPSLEIVSRNKLADGMRASPAAANGQLFVRTFSTLYCLGSKE